MYLCVLVLSFLYYYKATTAFAGILHLQNFTCINIRALYSMVQSRVCQLAILHLLEGWWQQVGGTLL